MVSTAYSDGYAVADGKVLEIGRAWLPGSACNYILVSAPYFLESGQEGLSFKGVEVSFLWLVPITAAEADFGRQYGGHSLFHKFAEAGTDLLQIDRRSIM
ncbi:hypothetical protein GCM10025331_26370 [Actinoplanes utahensis]|nr:hypothetical protein Aut01nite_38160 [Actinoplanes utahensis]